MRVMTACLVLLAIVSLAIISPAAALFDVGFMGPVNTGIPFVVGPCFTAAAPFSRGTAFMTVANTSALAHDYAGSLAISFEPGAGQVACGSFGFPFAPTIAQTSSETITAAQSYYFADFLAV